MNRLEREVVEELEADYEHDADRAVAIVALVREAVLQEIEDAKPDEPESPTITLQDYSYPATMSNPMTYYTTNNTGGATLTAGAIQQAVQSIRQPPTPPTLNVANMPQIVISVEHLQRFAEIRCECGDRNMVPLELWQGNEGVRKEVERYINMHLRLKHYVMGDPFKLP